MKCMRHMQNLKCTNSPKCFITTMILYHYTSLHHRYLFSCLKYDVFPQCTNLCGGHLSIKGKVSLFAVGLFTQTDQNRSEWQARKQQEPNL